MKTQPSSEVYGVSALETTGESGSRENLRGYRIGHKVKHRRLGNGEVQRFEGLDRDKRMIVKFERLGFKSLPPDDSGLL